MGIIYPWMGNSIHESGKSDESDDRSMSTQFSFKDLIVLFRLIIQFVVTLSLLSSKIDSMVLLRLIDKHFY